MGFFDFLTGGKKKEEVQEFKPNIPSYSSSPLGKLTQEELMRRIQGQGVGLPAEYVSRTTSPVIAQREARYRETERPQLEAAMSARGMGRSTQVADLLSRQAGAKERDIADILGEAYGTSEQLKRQEISQALGMAPGVVSGELAQANLPTQYEYQNYLLKQDAAEKEKQRKAQNDAAFWNNIIATGGTIAGTLLAGPYGGMSGGKAASSIGKGLTSF